VLNLVGPAGARRVALDEFFLGPGRTVLARGELLVSIDVPVPVESQGSAFGRVTRRRGVDLATVNLCGLVTASGRARFAFGAVGPTPFLVTDGSGAFSPGAATADREAGIRRLVDHASPISDVRGGREYRLAMLDVMIRRTLDTAIARLATQMESSPR
jgi:carbon-monoxide dehydrogenase medium subunit